MNTFDNDLRTAMQPELSEASLRSAGDEGMIQQVAATFRGRMRFWIVLTWAGTAVWVGVAIWAATAFFRATDARGWTMYAAIFLCAMMAVAMLKLWYLMEMNRNTHTREIKRVELQIARLAERLK